MNASKAKGTAAETAVVKYLRAHGFPLAERLALHGGKDIGDVRACPGFIIEVKAHATVTDGLIRDWIMETAVEMKNGHADCGLLVIKRPHKAVEDWWAIQVIPGLLPAMYWFGDTLAELRHCGWGEPE